MVPTELRGRLASGLLSFPVTHFHADGSLSLDSYGAHIEALSRHPAGGLFAAGGTGEFFSLTPDEVVTVTRTAKQAAGGMPIVAGCGYGTAMACQIARDAEEAGADGLLLLPPYLIGAPQEGLAAHVRAVCNATSVGVIVYNRANARLTAETLLRLADDCPNLVGFKDGTGDIENVREVTLRLGERFVHIGGMPTHELFAHAYFGAGVTTYSSAVFNFIPDLALSFFDALRGGDHATTDRILTEFFLPWADIRDLRPGYAVSAVKAGADIMGYKPGPVRPPLTDLTGPERDMLATLLDANRVREAAE